MRIPLLLPRLRLVPLPLHRPHRCEHRGGRDAAEMITCHPACSNSPLVSCETTHAGVSHASHTQFSPCHDIIDSCQGDPCCTGASAGHNVDIERRDVQEHLGAVSCEIGPPSGFSEDLSGSPGSAAGASDGEVKKNLGADESRSVASSSFQDCKPGSRPTPGCGGLGRSRCRPTRRSQAYRLQYIGKAC